jgi:hypothetical protein
MKSVYSAVRTVPLNKAVCAWSVKGYVELSNWLKYQIKIFPSKSKAELL